MFLQQRLTNMGWALNSTTLPNYSFISKTWWIRRYGMSELGMSDMVCHHQDSEPKGNVLCLQSEQLLYVFSPLLPNYTMRV